jgi:hypothetical protein
LKPSVLRFKLGLVPQVIAFNAATILFPAGGARLSTVLLLAAFLTLAVTRRDFRPAIAAVAWLVGFEMLFEATRRPDGWHAIVFIASAVVGIVLLARKGIAPSPLLMAATLALWAAWLATGFHVNQHTMVGFQPGAEAFNEGAKTLWGAAYLVPFLLAARRSRAPSRSPRPLPSTLRVGIPRAGGAEAPPAGQSNS